MDYIDIDQCTFEFGEYKVVNDIFGSDSLETIEDKL